MSDLASAAAATGVPEELLVRSASARAAVTGVSADDLLASWGGGAPAPTPTVAPEPAPEPAAAAAVEESVPEEPALEPANAGVAVAVPVAAAVVVADPEPAEVVEPASLGSRIAAGIRVGAILGTIFGIVLAVLAAPLVFDSLNAIQDDAGTRFVAELRPVSVVVGVGALSALFGALIARASVMVPAWMRPGLGVSTKPAMSMAVGAATGLVLGLIAAGILIGGLGEESTLEGHVAIDIIGSVVIAFIGGSVLGAVTGGATQLLAQPLAPEEQVDEEVKQRLSTAAATPLLVVGGIAVIVVALGVLLVELPSAAPFIAILAAGSILGLAALTASGSPKLKVGATEFFVAAAGLGVVILFIALVFSAQGGGHS